MNFTTNKKKRLSYNKRKVLESKSIKKRKINSSNFIHQQHSERFNFFLDLLSTNKKIPEKKKSVSRRISIRKNKENTPENVNNLYDNINDNKNGNKSITLQDINNIIVDDIENNNEFENGNFINNDGKEILSKDILNNGISSNTTIPDSEIIKLKDSELKKYFRRSQLLQFKENKIIQQNINLILNKENKLNKPIKINRKDIDIINQFQLNALGYINYYTKRKKELLHTQKIDNINDNIFKMNEEELEHLIDQEWIILEKKLKNRNIEEAVRKQTKSVKRKLKRRKENTNLNGNSTVNNQINLPNPQISNIPNIPDSEFIKNELKEYTEINLLTEMYNYAKQVPIPYFSVIKHPPNPFTIYTKDNINTIIKENPSLNRTEALKIVAKNWKNANKDEKRKYIEKSKEYKNDYEDLIKYAYLQRALINNPNIAKLCLEHQLRGSANDESKNENEENSEDENINFKDLDNDDEIIKAFNYIVKKFPKGYPLASPVLRFPERSISKQKKNQSRTLDISKENDLASLKKNEKNKNIIKPKSQAFDYFVKDRYALIFKSTPSISLSNLFDELEKEWKYLSYEDKLPYILLEIKDVKRYYMDQCEISKEKRGKKRRAASELLIDDYDQQLNHDDQIVNNSNTLIVSELHRENFSFQNNRNPKQIIRNKRNQNKHQYQTQNSTLIENSEDEHDYDNEYLYLEKNEHFPYSTEISGNSNIDESNYAHQDLEAYIDSDTSEEYLPFDNISRKFLFENYNEEEQTHPNNTNLYDFEIQNRFNDDNPIPIENSTSSPNNNTFIPVTDPHMNHSFSQDTVIYNPQEEKNNENVFNNSSKVQISETTINSNDKILPKPSSFDSVKKGSQSFMFDEESKSDIFLSPNTLIKNAMAHIKSSQSLGVLEGSPPQNKDIQTSTSYSNNNENHLTENDSTTLETPPAIIENSMKTLSSIRSDSDSLLHHDSNLETPKNSQKNKSLLKPLRPIRKSAIWKFGNEIDILKQVSEEKISFISNGNKEDNDNHNNDDVSNDEMDNNSSSSSSSSEEEEEEENVIKIKEKVTPKNRLKNLNSNNNNSNSKRQSLGNAKASSSPIKYNINKRSRMDEEEEEEEKEKYDDEKEGNIIEKEEKDVEVEEEEEEEDEIEEEEEDEEDEIEELDNKKENKNSFSISPNKTPKNKGSNSTLNINGKTKNSIKSFIFENSFVTPKKKLNEKFKYNYSSNKKKNFYGIERQKYDLF